MSSERKTSIALAALLCASSRVCGWGVQPPTIFVDAAASGPAHDGASWCSAFLTLDAALAIAAPGSTIRIADGRYTPAPGAGDPRDATFTIVSGVIIEGGYAGCGAPDPDDRDPVAHPTRLSGDLDGDDQPGFINIDDNARHVITAVSVNSDTALDGLIIEGGNGDNACGGALTATSANLRVTNCVFRANSSPCGGAIYLESGIPTIVHCWFEDNRAGNGGAVLCANDLGLAVPFAAGCDFRRNTATYSAGAWYNEEDAHSTIVNSVFLANHAPRAGAISGGDGDYLRLVHCTIVGNVAEFDAGGLREGLSFWTIENSVLADNLDETGGGETAQIGGLFGPPHATIRYSTIQGWTGSLGGVANDGVDPRFIDADGPDDIYGTDDDNIHLRPDSPCIDNGDPAFVVNPAAPNDIDGQPRILACRVDRGADEFFTGAAHSGDFNGNGSVGPEDVAPMISSLLTTTSLANCVGDLNNDGVADGRDIPPFIDAIFP